MGLGGHKDLHRALAKDLMIHIVGCVTIFNHLEPKFETLPIETDNLSLGKMHATMSQEKKSNFRNKKFRCQAVHCNHLRAEMFFTCKILSWHFGKSHF